MTLSLFSQVLINGLSMGMLIVLVVLGLDVILRLTGIVNFAQGQFYMIAVYVTYFTFVVLKLPYALALILTMLVLALFGIVSYFGIFNWVQRRFKRGESFTSRLLMSAVASLGLMMILSQGALLAFGTQTRGVPSVFPQLINIRGVILPAERLVIIAGSLLVLVGLYFLMFKTKIGKSMRAVTLDAEMSSLHGINPTWSYALGFVIGCGLCGIAGGLVAPVFSATLEVGQGIIFTAMIVLIVGGIGSYKGTILGGLLIGEFSSFGYYFLGGLTETLIFIVVIIILIFKPGGLLGKSMD